MKARFAIALFSLSLVASSALAADPMHGRGLAERWCSSCHLVSSTQTKASTDVPSFSEIARQPGFDAARLALFLLDPHPKMPDLSLTRSEAADLSAYIQSLDAAH